MGDDPFKNFTAEQFLSWLGAQPPEFQEQLDRALSRRPDLAVEAVKTLRRLAADPNAPRDVRDKALKIIKDTGFDDESLKKDDDEGV